MASGSRPGNAEVLAKIEGIFSGIAENLLKSERISIPLRYKNPTLHPSSQLDSDGSTTLTNVYFPARTPQEAKRFSRTPSSEDRLPQKLIKSSSHSPQNFGVYP